MQNAIYLRKSRADQGTVEDTLRKHKETLLDYAAKHNIFVSLNDIYEEVISGESLYARPQMLRLLSDVEAGKFSAVLCMDIDRLGRGGMSDQGIILDTFKSSNTKIITPAKTYDLNDELDENNMEFAAFIARFEYKQIRKRMRAGVKKSIQDGCYLANAPYGYVNITENKRATLAIQPEEAAYVRQIFDMYVNQGIGCQTIADNMNAMGAKPHRAAQFGRTSVMTILKNPVYIGKIVWDKKTHIRKNSKGNSKHIIISNPQDKWTVTQGLHPPIIDPETFSKAQEIIQNRYHPPAFTGVVINPLSGLIVCKNCGGVMQRAANCKGGPFCLCQKRGCMPMSKLAYVEQSLLGKLQLAADELAAAAQNPRPPAASKEDYQKIIKEIDHQIKTVRQQISRLQDLLEQNVYDIPTFLERQKKHSEKLAALENKKTSILRQANAHREIDIQKTRQRIPEVLAAYATAAPQQKNILLQTIVEKAVYYKEKGWAPAQFELEVALRPSFL